MAAAVVVAVEAKPALEMEVVAVTAEAVHRQEQHQPTYT
jgi:hypothetical protein